MNQVNEMSGKKITVAVDIDAPAEKAWRYFTEPAHIMQWNFASDDWECPRAENDVRVGGKLKSRMQAKDQSAGFEFVATYTRVEPFKRLDFTMGDGRTVQVEFAPTPGGTKVTETFEMESTHSEELQRSGWQAILDNFKKHVEKS